MIGKDESTSGRGMNVAMRSLARLFLALSLVIGISALAIALQQSHPLSQIMPVNVSLNMEQKGVFNASSVNVTDSAGTPLISLQPTGNIFAAGNLTYSGRTFILDTVVFNTTIGGGFNITTGNLTVDNGSIRIVNGGIFFNDTNSTDPIPMITMFGGGMPGDTNRPILVYSQGKPRLGLFFNGTGGSNGNDTFYFQNESGAPVFVVSTGNNFVGAHAFCIASGVLGCSDPGSGNLKISNGGMCIGSSPATPCTVEEGGNLYVEGNTTVMGVLNGVSNITLNGSLGIDTRLPNATFHMNGSNWVSAGTGQLLVTGTRGNVVGPAIRIDANYSGGQAGHQWDIISTATGADQPEGSIGFYDNTIARYVMVLYGKDNTGKVSINLTGVSGTPSRALAVVGGALATGGFVTGGPDIAEAINVTDLSVEAGDVVVASQAARVAAEKSVLPYDTGVIGVISTEPGLALYPPEGMDIDRVTKSNERLLAIAGRVPVKVTDENGPIAPGDLLTTSSTSGHAMRYSALEFTGSESPEELAVKLNENERRKNAIVGKALGPLDHGRGKLIALVKPR